MLRMNRWFMGALAAMLAAGLGSAPAQAADSLNVSEVAAALVLPYITGTGYEDGNLEVIEADNEQNSSIETFMTITNALSTPVVLKFVAIDGDEEGTWGTQSFQCYVTGRETTHIVVRNFRGVATAYLECNNPDNVGDPEEIVETEEPLIGLRGLLFVSLEDPDTGEKLVENAVFGDWAMLDFDDPAIGTNNNGEWAFGAEAIGFQAGNGTNHGPDLFTFDGEEYTRFPSVVASNFVAPDEFNEGEGSPLNTPRTQAALILFTLDGIQGVPPAVSVEGYFFDDDEVERDYDYKFRCMDVVRLAKIDPRFEDDILCQGEGADSRDPTDDCAGHFDMRATLSDDERLSPVHGWIVQADGENEDQSEDTIKDDERFWARTLNQSTGNFQPLTGDTVRLDLGSLTPVP